MGKEEIRMVLLVVFLYCVALAPLIANGESEYGSTCSISNVAPLIDETSFFLSNTNICMGESVEFAVDVSDANGASDVSSVMVVLSADGTISEDDVSLQLERTGSVSATTATFGTVWTVAGETGLKNILLAAYDGAHLAAENNGVNAGTIELNPVVGFEVKNGTGGALTAISFPESVPGAQNLSANQNAIQVCNIGGIAIDVYVHGMDMSSGNETIPVSNMRVDELPMSTTPQLIAAGVEPGASSSHHVYMDYPAVIPSGTYQGSVVFEIATA